MQALLSRRTGLAFAGLLALAACAGGEEEADKPAESKQGLALALAAPMMVDPALASRNTAETAIVRGGPPVMVLPPFERSAEEAAAAKLEAERVAGGAIPLAPMAEGTPDPALASAVAAAQRADAVRGPGKQCGAKADYALAWSLKLPAALPIYPRGHLAEAAGSDADGCKLRVVRFVTPVDTATVIDFYHARAKSAGFAVRHLADDAVHQLRGNKGAAEFAVQVRAREDGLTEADIVVNGL